MTLHTWFKSQFIFQYNIGILFIVLLIINTQAWSQTTSQDITIDRSGKELLVQNCSRCHAIATDDISTHSEAPAFRNLSKLYPVEDLEEALVEGIFTGHPDMPVFEFEREEVNEIISYLKSIQIQ